MTLDRTDRGASARRFHTPSPSARPGTPSVLAPRGDGEVHRDASTVVHLRPGLWDPASGRFRPARLRAAIVSRGWTVAEFAVTSGVSRACLYNALRSWATSDRTAIRIATTLATREPLAVLAAE